MSVRYTSFSAETASAIAPATVSALMLYGWPVVVGAHRGDDGHELVVHQPVDERRIDRCDVADEPEVGIDGRSALIRPASSPLTPTA